VVQTAITVCLFSSGSTGITFFFSSGSTGIDFFFLAVVRQVLNFLFLAVVQQVLNFLFLAVVQHSFISEQRFKQE
jgi:hypothetical protein